MVNLPHKKVVKGYAVIKQSPFTPAKYRFMFTIFKAKIDADAFLGEEVHPSQKARVVPCEIHYHLPVKKKGK